MASLNKVMLIGNVGADPVMRFTPNGNPVTTFNVATNRVYTASDGEKKQETDWFTINTWKKQAESCNQFLKKGQSVFVEGSLRLDSWEAQDGQKRSRMVVEANKVLFLDKQATTILPADDSGPDLINEVLPDDLPFNQ